MIKPYVPMDIPMHPKTSQDCPHVFLVAQGSVSMTQLLGCSNPLVVNGFGASIHLWIITMNFDNENQPHRDMPRLAERSDD